MLPVGHLVPVGGRVAAGGMHVRRIQIEHGVSGVVSADHFQRGRVLDLHALEPLHDLGQALRRPQPAGYGAGHSGPGSEHAVRPAAFAAFLRQAGARLPGADVKAPGALQAREALFRFAGADELLAGKRRQADGFDQPGPLISQGLKEIHQFRIDVVVGFRRERRQVHQHGGGAAVNVAEVLRVVRNAGQDEVEVAVLAPVPAESDQLFRLPARCAPARARRVDCGSRRPHDWRVGRISPSSARRRSGTRSPGSRRSSSLS